MSNQNSYQNSLIDIDSLHSNMGKFPGTRYQGSKSKVANWIAYSLKDVKYDSVLDGFGGTGVVSYEFKKAGKQVIYNDYLRFNNIIGKALIENNNVSVSSQDVDTLLTNHSNLNGFIFNTFRDIYFTDEENNWLDNVIPRIKGIKNEYKQAIMYFALFQSCTIKRPYNLFHRKNLYVRQAEVKRSFGNKKTWDTPFDVLFRKFINEANNAVFDNGRDNIATQFDILQWKGKNPDLVYLDPPYISKNGVGLNYFDFYHFLEGIMKYDEWGKHIDYESKHRKFINGKNEWCKKDKILNAFIDLFRKFSQSTIVVSYRDDGIPTISEISAELEKLNMIVILKYADYKYALSRGKSKETLIIATPK